MIVIQRKTDTDLLVEGHAGSDIYGHDLICAAVSTLTLTLEVNLKAMSRKGLLGRTVVHLEPGYARIHCSPREDRERAVKEVFDTVCLGFKALAERFPKYVTFLMQ